MWRKCITLILVTSLTSACVYYPKQVQYYDKDCDIESKRLVLDVEAMNGIGNCGGGEGALVCAAALLGVGAVTMIVSGSIVLIGNTAYWLEKQGNCTSAPKLQTSYITHPVFNKTNLS